MEQLQLPETKVCNKISLCNTETKVIKYNLSTSQTPLSIAISPYGNKLAFGLNNETYIWEPQKSDQPWLLTRTTTPATSLKFAPDGQTLVSGFKNGTILKWNIDTKQAVEFSHKHESQIMGFTLSN